MFFKYIIKSLLFPQHLVEPFWFESMSMSFSSSVDSSVAYNKMIRLKGHAEVSVVSVQCLCEVFPQDVKMYRPMQYHWIKQGCVLYLVSFNHTFQRNRKKFHGEQWLTIRFSHCTCSNKYIVIQYIHMFLCIETYATRKITSSLLFHLASQRIIIEKNR